nr:MAG TPA: hypothetical protein [Caudoviricetes sp.]
MYGVSRANRENLNPKGHGNPVPSVIVCILKERR